MIPKTLKPWSYVKNLKHDISSIRNKQWGHNNPEQYYYQLDRSSSIYSPVCLVSDFDLIPEKVVLKND